MTWSPWLNIPYRRGGSDYDGCDCWGLVRLVYWERLGIELPSLGPLDPADDAAVQAAERALRPSWEEVERPRELDVALFMLDGVPRHVGLVVDGRRVLHVLERARSRVERVDLPPWRDRRVGVFRCRLPT